MYKNDCILDSSYGRLGVSDSYSYERNYIAITYYNDNIILYIILQWQNSDFHQLKISTPEDFTN